MINVTIRIDAIHFNCSTANSKIEEKLDQMSQVITDFKIALTAQFALVNSGLDMATTELTKVGTEQQGLIDKINELMNQGTTISEEDKQTLQELSTSFQATVDRVTSIGNSIAEIDAKVPDIPVIQPTEPATGDTGSSEQSGNV